MFTHWDKLAKRIAGIVTTVALVMNFAGNASARILFQDDNVGNWESKQIKLGSNDSGTGDTSIQFGADGTGSENGVINWNTTTNIFDYDHGINVTGAGTFSGTLTANGALDANGQVDLGDGGDTMSINATTANWDLTDLDFDIAGNPSEISLNSDGASDNLTIEVTGATDSSLVLQSTGTGTAAVDVNATAGGITADAAGAISLDSGAASNFTTSVGALTLNGADGVNIAGNAAEVDVTTTGAVDINSGAFTVDGSTVSLDGTDTTNLTMTADADAAKTLTITSTNVNVGASATAALDINADDAITIDSTSAGISIDGAAASNFSTSAGAITFSGGEGVNVDGTGQEVDITTAGALIDLNSGTFTLDTSSTFSIDGVGASNVTTDSGALTLSTTTTGAVTVNGVDGVNIAGNAAEVDVTTTGAVDINSGVFTVDTTGAGTDITLTAVDDVIINGTDFDVDATGNVTIAAAADYFIGTTSLKETTSATDSGAYLIGTFDEFTNSNGANVQDVLDDLDAAIGSNAANNVVLTFSPEYPDTVIFQDGSSNNGMLESNYDESGTENEHYYKWTTQQAAAQDIELRFRYPLPADFASTGDFTYRFLTGSAVEAENDVEVRLYNATNETLDDPTLCATDATNVSTTWATGTITAATVDTGCTGGTALNAGDIVEVRVTLIDATAAAGTLAEVGTVAHAYNN